MKKQTKAEKLIAELTRRYPLTFKEVQSSSRKYRKFTHPLRANEGIFYFVGKAGALRVGKSISDSFSISNRGWVKALLNKDD